MSRKLFPLVAASALALCICCFGQPPLPTYEDFRRVDRLRRLLGQLNTAELLEITRIEPALIARTATAHAGDAEIVWGAAELATDWSAKRGYFERALAAGGTNTPVALRFACAAARNGEPGLAGAWLAHCKRSEPANVAPWLVELWMSQQWNISPEPLPASAATWKFDDYAAGAARARIRLLEAAGYSAYSARRLGFMPEPHLLEMVRELARRPTNKELQPFLLGAARAMQRDGMFLLTELVGQTLEHVVLSARPDALTSPEVSLRRVELDRRREQLRTLLAELERNAVEFATEAEMVRYFDEVISLGEEAAMKRLRDTVGGQPSQ
jgi:hypothetical protein